MSELARQVYVVSDLHLGGEYARPGDPNQRGFRMCTNVPALAEFVDRLAAKEPGPTRTELVVNGDAIDFLAEGEENAQPFLYDARQAAAVLDQLVERDRAFFQALHAFLEKGHRLTVLLGNHDIELALPMVRQQLRERLGLQGHHDFQLLYDGEAYVVGDALIEHGNRYDSMNFVDYPALARVRNLQSRGIPLAASGGFEAPVGSKLVSSVFNEIKKRYGFIDLLKPESLAVAPLLLALEPGLGKKLAEIGRLALTEARRLDWKDLFPSGSLRPQRGVDSLGIGQDISSSTSSGVMGGEMGGQVTSKVDAPESWSDEEALRRTLRASLGEDTEDFLQTVPNVSNDTAIGQDISSVSDTFSRAVGLLQLVLSKNEDSLQKRLPMLRRALHVLQDDRTFDRATESGKNYFEAAEKLAGFGFRYVIFGHTHLAREISLESGATYLNTGTWADLMEFPKEVLDVGAEGGSAKLLEFVRAMAEGDYGRWIDFRPTYVRLDIGASGKTVGAAELCQFDGTDP